MLVAMEITNYNNVDKMESDRTKSLEDSLTRVYTELKNSVSDEEIDAVHRKIRCRIFCAQHLLN